ncbi:MAG: hypothetical protein ACJAVS_001809, partial [Paracoccaceae bacterium]
MFRNEKSAPVYHGAPSQGESHMMISRALAAATLVAGLAAPVMAQELPGQLTWTAYDTGSAGYNQSVAIGAALKESAGVNLRVLPGKNDISRTEPVRQGKVPYSA